MYFNLFSYCFFISFLCYSLIFYLKQRQSFTINTTHRILYYFFLFHIFSTASNGNQWNTFPANNSHRNFFDLSILLHLLVKYGIQTSLTNATLYKENVCIGQLANTCWGWPLTEKRMSKYEWTILRYMPYLPGQKKQINVCWSFFYNMVQPVHDPGATQDRGLR